MRLAIVSNRLPFTVTKVGSELRFEPSSGGLATGLRSYLGSRLDPGIGPDDHIWIGWPGTTLDERIRVQVETQARAEFKAETVFLSEKAMDRFYHGFCNKTIWPLFHYFPSYTHYDSDFWEIYRQVNDTFRDAVLKAVDPQDVIWIHDYHLMLLPEMIRRHLPQARIGFFLHIPFPSYELFRLLPRAWRTEMLQGVLGADLIGFHTHEYAQHFLTCAMRILGHEHSLGRLLLGNRIVKVETFPMGIDFRRFKDTASSPEAENEKARLHESFAGLKTVLSLDRLDYTKGILNRLHGYEIFLEKNLQWRERVVLILVVVPSRIGVEHYQSMKKQIDEMVGKINGRFGTVKWTPIMYQYRSVPFEPLTALYASADVALVTPLRDGMNLIAKEYLACRTDQTGVLILSEMAGAARELSEAIIINPNDPDEIAGALGEALGMPVQEQARRNLIMQNRLSRYDVVQWANHFLFALLSLDEQKRRMEIKLLDTRNSRQLLRDFAGADDRLLLLDYDGTLVPFAVDPHLARQSVRLLELLRLLAARPGVDLNIVSGRERQTLEQWFGNEPFGLVAEHGAWVRKVAGEWTASLPLETEWMQRIYPLLATAADRLPGSFVEKKEFSLAWHYRGADPELGPVRAKELSDDLVNYTANVDIQVLQGNKVIEVRCSGVNKGTAARRLWEEKKYGFILAIGDDWTDEELFGLLPESAYSIRVGVVDSLARFNLPDQNAVVRLLEELIL